MRIAQPVGEHGPYAERAVRPGMDPQQTPVADQQQVLAKHVRAMRIVIVRWRLERRRDGAAGAEQIDAVGKHRPDAAIRRRPDGFDAPGRRQPVPRTEPAEA